MSELDSLVAAVNHVNPMYLYVTLFMFAFIENLFPPTPSDLAIAFGGSLVGIGKLGLVATIVSATLGSTAGFILMYYVGLLLGKRLIDSGKPRFLPFDKIRTAERWFQKYGYWLVVTNRFLSGTRAVISFFVGLSELPVVITLPLCALSALLWNSLLVYGGSVLGRNWRLLEQYLEIYGYAVLVLVVIALSIALGRRFLGRKHA